MLQDVSMLRIINNIKVDFIYHNGPIFKGFLYKQSYIGYMDYYVKNTVYFIDN